MAGLHATRQRASPHESTSATIDDAELTITYGRPYMRGRTIFGGLVPYGRIWCPGADEATILTTDRALKFAGLDVPAGHYTLWMRPTADAWTLIVNRQTGQWHLQYDPAQDLGHVPLETRTLARPVQQLTFDVERRHGAPGGVLRMRWATTEASAPFTVVK